MKQLFLGATSAALLSLAVGGPANADMVLSGPDSNAGTYSTANLATFASANPTAAVTDAATGLSGVSIWGLLGGANASSPTSPIYGALTTNTPAGDNGKNAILRYYLVGTDASGNQSVVSLGEVDPAFGGTGATKDYIAYQVTGGSNLTAPELIIPGAPGRDLTTLTKLQILSVPAQPGSPPAPGGQSSSVQLSGASANVGSYNAATLASTFAPSIVTELVSGDTYTGVPLWTFLSPTDASTLTQIVITQGTDGYEVALSLAELDPALGGNPNDLLPYADTGTDFPGSGVARTILPADNKHGRWMSNLSVVTVAEIPEPASSLVLPLALGAMGALRRRRA